MAPSVRVLLVEDSKVLTERLTEAIDQIAFALGATHFLDKARDSGRLPEVLHEICEAHHLKH